MLARLLVNFQFPEKILKQGKKDDITLYVSRSPVEVGLKNLTQTVYDV
jgi:hypothetical protein